MGKIMKLDNPAARLLAILEAGRNLSDTKNCREAWSELLGVKKGDQAVLMGRIGRVMVLSTDIIERLENIGNVKIERYMHWVQPLEKAFTNNNLDGQWKAFKGHVNTHVINYLSITSDFLSLRCPEPTVSETNLNSILTTSRDLIDDIREADLPDSAKEFMIRQLYQVCLAVEEYIIRGSGPLSTAVESAFGYGVLHKESVELAKTDPVAKKFWQSMANIALIVSISTGVQQLAPPIIDLLPDICFDGEGSAVETSSGKDT
tara:strand:+ start:1973 stop:2755 length:783 start_codon:yes stop_codon:yes gene_type:complete